MPHGCICKGEHEVSLSMSTVCVFCCCRAQVPVGPFSGGSRVAAFRRDGVSGYSGCRSLLREHESVTQSVPALPTLWEADMAQHRCEETLRAPVPGGGWYLHIYPRLPIKGSRKVVLAHVSSFLEVLGQKSNFFLF